MAYDPAIHRRRSVRLPGRDYSDGWYFLTICLARRGDVLGRIENEEFHENRFGCVVREEWLRIATKRKEVELDHWIVMPDHLHAIVSICPKI